jgi:hypothetical protein
MGGILSRYNNMNIFAKDQHGMSFDDYIKAIIVKDKLTLDNYDLDTLFNTLAMLCGNNPLLNNYKAQINNRILYHLKSI